MSKKIKVATKPLSGIRVLVGRAKHQAGALSAELRQRGADVIEIPFIEIRKPKSFKPLDAALRDLDSYDWLILTSVNGVEAMWERTNKMGLRPADVGSLRVAAIGPATEKAIHQRGTKVDVVPKEYVAESVVRSLKNKVKGKRVLLVRAKVARDVIPRELRKAGAQVEVVEAYETVVPESSRARLRAVLKSPKKRPHVVTFTSSSTVKNFVELLGSTSKTGRAQLAEIKMASIGPVTSATLREFGLPVDIAAKEFTIPGLVAAIVAKTNSPIFPARMRANLRMQDLLRGAKIPLSLTPKLKKILDTGFVHRGGCLLLALEASHSLGGTMDRSGYECFVNHIHTADFPQAWLYANELAKRLSVLGLGECMVIVSYDGKDATVRFHRIRHGQSWLRENLESYREEAIAVIHSV